MKHHYITIVANYHVHPRLFLLTIAFIGLFAGFGLVRSQNTPVIKVDMNEKAGKRRK
jgi:hypothetical protein